MIPVLVHNFDFHMDDTKGEIKNEYISFVKQKNVWASISKRVIQK